MDATGKLPDSSTIAMLSFTSTVAARLLGLVLFLLILHRDTMGGLRSIRTQKRTAVVAWLTSTLFPAVALSATLPISQAPLSRKANKDINLAQRVLETDSIAYEPGIKESDIFYPSWFSGIWVSNSTCTGIASPLGLAAFGGQRAYRAALNDVNQSLIYDVFFTPSQIEEGRIIADRLKNVESIARASIGFNSVVESKQPDTDFARRLHVVLSPPGGDIIDIDLIPTDRSSQETTTGSLQCFERTAQLVSNRIDDLLKQGTPKVARKDIETVTVYRLVSPTRIEALQRTATFLSPVDSRFKAISAVQPLVANRAVDIRFYQITYDKKP